MMASHFGRARLQATVSALQSISSSCGCHQNDMLNHGQSGILFSIPGLLTSISRLYKLCHGWSTWILQPGPALSVVTGYFCDNGNMTAAASNLHGTGGDGGDAEDFFWVNPPLELASLSHATPSDVDVGADAGAGTVSTNTSASFTTTISDSLSDTGSAADSAPDSEHRARRGQGKGQGIE
ncbi:hypothetical protein Vretimale_3241 [Volvox reticuliferus]|uniref:Uncharacterized protein n=1 Tax=Volvox reticuliferus TaxID=1737510 RepID=A0A8J4G3I4_9CHLO|nr:hypothetical protein Vretifemale_6604 [Volvox reticuliferus]GIL97661.1 hypothetical protein Vretimale_3241 [Volvox reticuliferus]